MEQDKYITQFSTYLFWDVKREDLDMEKHSRYIIKRVLEYGMLLDWKMVLQYYGLDRIVELAKTFRDLEPSGSSLSLCYISHLLKNNSDVTLINSRTRNTGTFKKVTESTYTK